MLHIGKVRKYYIPNYVILITQLFCRLIDLEPFFVYAFYVRLRATEWPLLRKLQSTEYLFSVSVHTSLVYFRLSPGRVS